MFGGVWGLFPDRLDFRVFRFGNVYADTNAYVQADGSWLSREIPSSRTPEGLTTLTVREENQAELVIASKGRSGGQWDRWQVAWAPIGSDGYPKPLWDKKTGHIDRAVAEAMRQSGYDLRDYAGAELEDVRPAAGGEAAHRRGGHGQLFSQPRRLPHGDVLESTKEEGSAVLCGECRVWSPAQAAWVAAVDESGVAQDHDRAGGIGRVERNATRQ